MTWAPRWIGRKVAILGVVGAAAVGLVLVSSAHARTASAAPAAAPDASAAALHAECPNLIEAYPGSSEYPATAGFYGLPTGFTITGGTLTVGTVARTANIRALACGYFILPTLNARFTATSVTTRGAPDECPGCSISFPGGAVTIAGLVTLPTQLEPAGPSTATTSAGPGPNGGLQLNVSLPVNAVVRIPEVGVVCTIGPIHASLTTAVSGALTGTALSGPLRGSRGRLVGARFTVPGGTASTDCPAPLIPPTNALIGLPAAPGGASTTAQIGGINSLNLAPRNTP